MPDRDFAIRAVGPRWSAACRLYVLDGASEAATDKASETLARVLRELPPVTAINADELRSATAREIGGIEQLLRASLLAPSRTVLLENGVNFEQISTQESRLIATLRGDIEYLAQQRVRGRKPRRKSKRRPSLPSVLARAVKVTFGR